MNYYSERTRSWKARQAEHQATCGDVLYSPDPLLRFGDVIRDYSIPCFTHFIVRPTDKFKHGLTLALMRWGWCLAGWWESWRHGWGCHRSSWWLHLPGQQHWGWWCQFPHSQGGLLGGLGDVCVSVGMWEVGKEWSREKRSRDRKGGEREEWGEEGKEKRREKGIQYITHKCVAKLIKCLLNETLISSFPGSKWWENGTSLWN